MDNTTYMLATTSVLIVTTVISFREYQKAFQEYQRSDGQFRTLEHHVTITHILTVCLAFICLMPLVGISLFWKLAMSPVRSFGLTAVLSGLLLMGKYVFKIDWLKLIFRDPPGVVKCVVLSLAGLIVISIVAPLVRDPGQLVDAIVHLHPKGAGSK